MISRFVFHQITHVYKQDLRLLKPSSLAFFRSLTTANTPTQLTSRTRRWAIRRYALLIGLPVTSFVLYRLSTPHDARRKHGILFGSIGRVIR